MLPASFPSAPSPGPVGQAPASPSAHAPDTPHRFAFGKNWKAFLNTLDDQRVDNAVASLRRMLRRDSLQGLRFLDIGNGSGLFSLAAWKLGATVTSFDYDQDSVDCALALRQRHGVPEAAWTVMQGSVLDAAFLEGLGTFDIVYSWGVLHHTGDMWRAIHNAAGRVRPGGSLCISIYNDEGLVSTYWKRVKVLYNRGPLWRRAVLATHVPYYVVKYAAMGLVKRRDPLWEFRRYKDYRGMSIYRDWVDWLGGLPFEVAAADQIFAFLQDRRFLLRHLVSSRGGCNEFLFQEAGQAWPFPDEGDAHAPSA